MEQRKLHTIKMNTFIDLTADTDYMADLVIQPTC